MYFQNLDELTTGLLENGAVKLPSVLNAPWRTRVLEGCLSEIGTKTYGVNLPSNIWFLNEAGILSELLPKLVKLADKLVSINVNENDIYNVCRVVRPGDRTEGYRGHFDSHLFTLVTPIQIPHVLDTKNVGQLHYFPNLRRQPKTELQNISGKIYYKKFNSEEGFDDLSKRKYRVINDFNDYCPLLFLGNTTFHGNSPIDDKFKDNRVTILTHFFDPAPKFGIGNIMRILRSR